MKSIFNKKWNSSVQPRKQIKFRLNAPNHIKRKMMGSPLDKILKGKYGIKTLEVKKGDEVKVLRGKFKSKKGKVSIVDIQNSRIQIDGVSRNKKGGEKIPTWFSPSKVKIVSIEENDKKRLKNIKNKSESTKTENKEKKQDALKKE